VYPLCSKFMQDQQEDIANGESGVLHEVLLWFTLLLLIGVRILFLVGCYTSAMLIINNSIPREYLGAANGLSQMIGSGMRAIGPFLAGSLWSWSLVNGLPFPFNHYMVFLMSGMVSLVGFFLGLALDKKLFCSPLATSATEVIPPTPVH
jgi:MFS family permease